MLNNCIISETLRIIIFWIFFIAAKIRIKNCTVSSHGNFFAIARKALKRLDTRMCMVAPPEFR